MLRRWMAMCALVSVSSSLYAATPDERSRLSDLRAIPLHSGLNSIPNLAGDGRTGTIIDAWRDNGNAHGYSVFMVLLPSTEGDHQLQVVGIDNTKGVAEFMRDDPHTGEDALASVVFARGRLDGKPVTLLIEATRDFPKTAIPDPSRTTIAVYSLRRFGGGVGSTPDDFELVFKLRTTRTFCHSEMALHQELGLPLSREYGGSAKPSGC
jgi:hypothetical protein